MSTTTLERENPLGTEPIFKLLVRFSVPAIVGMMVNALYNIVDRIYIATAHPLEPTVLPVLPLYSPPL